MEFEVLELIGRGSFGNVRKVRRLSDGRLCVRKEISYIHMNPKERSQLIDEFRILKLLDHPNIVEYIYHEHVPEDHMVYLYMEYCDGGDLSQIIKAHKKKGEYVDEDLIWSIFTQLIMALYRCHYGMDPPPLSGIFQADLAAEEEEVQEPPVVNHEMKIIHRDIKPDNVFLLKDNFVKLGDFGLAKLLLLESEFATTYVGTPYYMSPELLMDKPYTPLSDIWSLGCVMYELCALHPPFQAKTHLQLQSKIKQGEFPDLPAQYSQKLRLTINACIVLDIGQRPSSFTLLQEISIKIFRKAFELKLKESQLAAREASIDKSLKIKESLLAQEKSRLTEKFSQEMNYQKKTIEHEIEEIRIQYQNEFQFVVDKEVNSRLKMLLQQPQVVQQLYEGYKSKSGLPAALKLLNDSHKHAKQYYEDSIISPSLYGGVTGSQNLNANSGTTNLLNLHNNTAFLSKKKKYYNELYEENTASPFLRTFNTNL